MISTHPPASLQGVLWSVNVQQLDMQKDKEYIIHQVLINGTMKDLKWLFTTYGKSTIAECFLNHPMKIYPRIDFFFVKNLLLSLSNIQLDENLYMSSTPGINKIRTSGKFGFPHS